jgi:putative DNA primase/helicase
MAINPQPQTPPPPSITISTDLTGMVNAAQQALLTMPGAPHIFQRARHLCLIAHGVKPPKWLQRPADAPVIVELDRDYLLELVNQAADWQKMSKKKKQAFEAAMPPAQVIKTLLARPIQPFPLLEGVIGAPTLKPDGEILATPGYDPDTGLYLALNGTTYPPIPTKPRLDHARSAIGLLQEAFKNFPWVGEHARSATTAALLSLVARYAFAGHVPLFAVRSTIRGSGKGLLIDAISTIATGRQAPRWAQTLDEEEERKRLLTLGLAGDSLVHIDNVVHPLGSGPLDLAVTAPTFCDRILGTQKRQETPMNVVFFASGNNMVFRGDMARRVVPIDLDPKMEKPEERTGFAHSPLLPWLLKERPKLITAALTLLKAYFVAGCPAQSITTLGSFEAWSTCIRQAIIWAGEPDPCEGRKAIESESDPQYEALAVLLEAWEKCYQTTTKTLKQTMQDISLRAVAAPDANNPPNAWNELGDALSTYDNRYDGKRLDTTRIGNALRPIEGRVLGNKRLIRDGTYQRAAKWRIDLV